MVPLNEEEGIFGGDSGVFALINEAYRKGGYSIEDLDNRTDNCKIIGFMLTEKSIHDGKVRLELIVDQEKVIGAYLSYEGDPYYT